MWRSCLRLRDGGRRLLNRPRSGLTASKGLEPKPPSPIRAYVPPAGEGGQGGAGCGIGLAGSHVGREVPREGRDRSRAHARRFVLAGAIFLCFTGEAEVILVFRRGNSTSGSGLSQGRKADSERFAGQRPVC